MTLIYVPRLIESAEQAEALPPRTPVLMGPFVAHRPYADLGWVVTDAGGEYGSEELIAAHSHLNPTALVPIEAKEEKTRVEPFADGTVHVGPQHWRDEPSRRLVTPWTPTEEA